MQDPYALLGVVRGTSGEDIRRAYRRLVMRWHPDRNPTREAEERFKQIKAAYELLLDADALAAWEIAQAAAAGAAGSSEEITLVLSLEEAASGCHKTLTLGSDEHCTECAGKGVIVRPSSVPCRHCKGIGLIRASRSNAVCTHCAGRGYVRETTCEACHGQGWQRATRQVEVKVPPGMHAGERLRLARQLRRKAAVGDIFVRIELAPHALFSLEGKDLLCQMPVSVFRLLLGGEIEVPTLTGFHRLILEPYQQHGLDYRLPGLGYPGRHGRGSGPLRLSLLPVYPQHFASAEQEWLAKLELSLQADLARHAPVMDAWARRVRERG